MVPRILLIVGATLIAGGCWLLLSASPHAESARAAKLSVVQPLSARESSSNTEVLLEGHLLAREALGPEGFVVYEKEQYLRTETEGAAKGKQQWQALSVPRASISVELNGSAMPVCNRDYAIANPPQRWQSDAMPMSRDLLHSTVRLRGFKSGDEVTGRLTARHGRR